MAQFCTVSFGYGWFRQPRDFFDLISSRLAEPCGKHVPRALFNSVIFAEQAAELEEGLRLSKKSRCLKFPEGSRVGRGLENRQSGKEGAAFWGSHDPCSGGPRDAKRSSGIYALVCLDQVAEGLGGASLE